MGKDDQEGKGGATADAAIVPVAAAASACPPLVPRCPPLPLVPRLSPAAPRCRFSYCCECHHRRRRRRRCHSLSTFFCLLYLYISWGRMDAGATTGGHDTGEGAAATVSIAATAVTAAAAAAAGARAAAAASRSLTALLSYSLPLHSPPHAHTHTHTHSITQSLRPSVENPPRIQTSKIPPEKGQSSSVINCTDRVTDG